MRRLAAFFALVLASLWITDCAIDAGLRSIRTSTFGVFNRIVDGQINSRILITGSSRAVNHYDARLLARATNATTWNIGINGSQTDMQLAVLETYLLHNAPPALIIHNLDSFSFVTSREGIVFPDSYLPYLDQAPIYNTLSRINGSWRKARFLPLYGYAVQDMRFSWMLGLAALVGRNPPEDRFDGFEPRRLMWTDDFERFRRSVPDGVRFPVEREGIDDLDRLVSLATGAGARVVLVYSPVYYEMQELERDRGTLFQQFEGIASRHHALLWDYSDSSISRQRHYFYNSQHLNADGAAVFSEDLARRIATAGLVGRPAPGKNAN